MEMDSTSRGRSFDRSARDPATLKKARLLTEETTFLRSSSNIPNGGNRPLVQRQPTLGFRPATERDRDSESSDSTRGGGGYQPQSLSQSQLQQHQHQELVSQYRTALSELTFNSKPIITNLTIIAGENLHAAKAIAATICNNILEVPSDQKLPSLYLLDSIVKNIGRDYIKYFAARLPEVFCKAYRQVDSAVHPGMRHLFGTWKGVFPPQTLQVIEKELGFQPSANGSSTGLTTSRSESQPQRPGRSIHVNPKYLEARQRLQQSSTVKAATSDSNMINSPEDTERRDRTTANVSSGRPRTDPRLKNIRQAQRDAEGGSIRENDSAPYSEFDYGSDVLNPSEFGKSSEMVAEQGFDKSWYGPGSNSMETIPGQRNGFDIKHGFSNYSAPKSSNADVKLQPTNNIASKRGSEVNRSWKNSEEEEYMWDDMNSRLAIPGKSGSSSKRDPRAHSESEKMIFEKNRLQKPHGIQDLGSRLDREASSDSLSAEQREGAIFRQQMPSLRSQGLSSADGISRLGPHRNLLDHAEGYSTSFSGVSTSVNSLSRTSLQPHIGSSHIGAQGLGFPPNATTGQQRHAIGAATLSGQAPVHQRPPAPPLSTYHSNRIPHDLAGQDQPTTHPLVGADGKPARPRGQKNMGLPGQSSQDSFQALPQISHLGNSQKPEMRNLQTSSHQLPLHPTKHAPFLQPLQSGTVSEPSQPPTPPVDANLLVSSTFDHSKSSADIPETSSTGNLLAAVSSLFGSKSVAGSIPQLSSQKESNSRPPLPSGLPPTQFTSSGSRVISAPISPSSQDSTLLSASILQRGADRLPLPSGSPLLLGTTSTQTSSVASAASNPVSSLLNTLVAKGLISASTTDSPLSDQAPTRGQSPNIDTPAPEVVPPLVVSSVLSTSSRNDEPSLSNSAAKSIVTVPSSTTAVITSLIGFDFKPDVIRRSHPAVISEFMDGLPHQCHICGLRFKLQERFDRHIEWHKLKNHELNTPSKASRRWFMNSADWVNKKPEHCAINENTGPVDFMEEAAEIDGEQMVTADESQCLCVLCGELFDDFYSQEMDKWMFKGAVHLSIIDGEAKNIGATRGPIVHADCVSEHSLSDLGLVNDVKREKGE